MLTMGFTAFLAVLIGLTTARRMVLNESTPWLLWPVLLASICVAPATAYTALFPGEVVDSATVAAEDDTATLTVPEGHALLVTGLLVPLSTAGLEDEDYLRTNYVFKLSGPWKQTVVGEVQRTSESVDATPSITIDVTDRVRAVEKPQVVWMGQNLQDRYRLNGAGEMKVTVHNWQGKAAETLLLEVVKDTPPNKLLLGAAGLLGLLALFCDVKLGTDRLSADVGFLTVVGYFIANGITPAGGMASTLMEFAGALVTGGLTMGIAGAVAEKLFKKGDA